MGRSFEDRWRERFEEFAELSDDEAGIAGWSVTGLDARVRRFRSLWSPGASAGVWLDAGCGAGTYARLLLEQGHRVAGVDYSLPALRKVVDRGHPNLVLAVADVRALPFASGRFDGVLCFGVMQALSGSEAAVRELARQVRPGGELWIDALNRGCVVHLAGTLRRLWLRKPQHLRYESPWRLARLLRECGLTDVEVNWMPIAPGRGGRLQRFLESRPLGAVLRTIPPLGMLASHAYIVHGRKPPRDPPAA